MATIKKISKNGKIFCKKSTTHQILMGGFSYPYIVFLTKFYLLLKIWHIIFIKFILTYS